MCVSSEPHTKPWPFTAKMTADWTDYSSQKSLLTWQKSMSSWARWLRNELRLRGRNATSGSSQKEKTENFFPSHCQQVSKKENMRRAQLQNHSLWYDRSKSHALFALQIISSSFPESKARKEDTSSSQAGAPQSMLQGCLSWWDLLPSPGAAEGTQACLQGCISLG